MHQTSPIKLFEGRLTLHKDKEIFNGDGYIEVQWRPFPRIGLKINCYPTLPFKSLPTGKAHLEAPDNPAISFNVYIYNVHGDREGDRPHLEILGDLTQPETIPKNPIDCSEVRFHLVNLEGNFEDLIHEGGSLWNGRLSLDSEKFKIVVDLLPNAQRMLEKMQKFGGYSITHTGSAVFRKGNAKYEEVEDLLEALYYYFAFLNCRWCGPVLSVGLSNGVRAWDKWDIVTNEWYANVTQSKNTGKTVPISSVRDKLRLTSWQSMWAWTKACHPDLDQVFKGFMAKWEKADWKDSLRTAIFLYVEANQAAGGTEGAIILAQAALELLADLHSSDCHICKLCKGEFEKINADGRIRWLLEDLDIPVELDLEMHPDLGELRDYCDNGLQSEKFKDGPKAIALHRNAITHPIKGKIETILSKTPDKVKLEILDLAIWYLEMVLLRSFEYNGEYANRLWRFRDNRTGSGFIQQIPWKGISGGSHCDNLPNAIAKE